MLILFQNDSIMAQKATAQPYPKLDLSDTEPAFGYTRFTNTALLKRIWWFRLMNSRSFVQLGEVLLPLLNNYDLLKKWMINPFFKIFCGGETPEQCFPVTEDLLQSGITSILDYSVEGGGNENAFDDAEKEILRSIKFAKQTDGISLTVFKVTAFENTDYLSTISTKLQSGHSLTTKEWNRWQRLRQRVERVCQTAYSMGVKIMIDAEETWLQFPIDSLANEMMQKYNKQHVTILNTYQMYLRCGLDKLKQDHLEACKKGYLLGAKIVRGAYMEKERERADIFGYESPIHLTKEDTDSDYNKGIEYCLKHHDEIFLFAGTHNEKSIYRIIDLLETLSIPKKSPHLQIAQLFGMGDTLSFNLAKHGFNVSKYLPYGKAGDCLPYLLRRAYENTASLKIASKELQLLRKEIKRRKNLKYTNRSRF